MTDIVEKLQALHVWPQFVADTHADVISKRQGQGLYDVGNVATEATDLIVELRRQLANARYALSKADSALRGGHAIIVNQLPHAPWLKTMDEAIEAIGALEGKK